MYYSAIVLHEQINPECSIDLIEKTSQVYNHFRTGGNPRKYNQTFKEIQTHKKNYNTTGKHYDNYNKELYVSGVRNKNDPPKNLRMHLMDRTRMLLYSKRKSLMERMVQKSKEDSMVKPHNNSVHKMTHSYFYGNDRHNNTWKKLIQEAQPENPFKNHQRSMSIQRLNHAGSSVLQQSQIKKIKSIQKIVEKIQSRKSESLANPKQPTYTNMNTDQQQYNTQNTKVQAYSYAVSVPIVMQLRTRRALNHQRKLRNNFTPNVQHYNQREYKKSSNRRPNTTFNVTKRNSANWNGQDNLAPW